MNSYFTTIEINISNMRMFFTYTQPFILAILIWVIGILVKQSIWQLLILFTYFYPNVFPSPLLSFLSLVRDRWSTAIHWVSTKPMSIFVYKGIKALDKKSEYQFLPLTSRWTLAVLFFFLVLSVPIYKAREIKTRLVSSLICLLRFCESFD